MNKKEIAEIKKQFSPDRCAITRIRGCYVNGEKEKKAYTEREFLLLPEEEIFKYFDIFKKMLSGHIGKNLLNLEYSIDEEMAGTPYNYTTHTFLHEHHVYGGANRSISEAEGFKVYLCLRHHIDGPEAVHNNCKNMRLLQQDCQRVYEKTHTRDEFMKLIGRNYLE